MLKIKRESMGAILLFFSSLLALVLSNTATSFYHNLTSPIFHGVNEGFMTLFFLVVGLEIKYELMRGSLNCVRKASLPAIAALGGMLLPALLYVLFNYQHPSYLKGWAIPTATDIAFSLGILTFMGSRIPKALKIFLMALAIFDDLAAIVVIAIFYTEQISFFFLALALLCLILLFFLNIKNVQSVILYGLVGVLLWYVLAKSGIHATLAGVTLAFFMPLKQEKRDETLSPLWRLKHGLEPWVSFFILPLFAFVNAGVSFQTIHLSDLQWSLLLGAFFALFLGKPIGVLAFCWCAVKCHLGKLPAQLDWKDMSMISVLCGIGFTVSLFIDNLAFANQLIQLESIKIGVLLASLGSGLLAYLIFWLRGRKSCHT